MNIEKIKNYNQKMLAILFSLGVLFAIVGLIGLIIELLPSWPWTHQDSSGLISDERVDDLNQKNLRKQVISYESPWLIDTVNSVYVIPVSIKTLKKPEEVSGRTRDEFALSEEAPMSVSKAKGYYYQNYFDGNYANLIIYNPAKEKTAAIFNERIFIGNVSSYYFKDDILLVFYSVDKDTDKNGVIDLDDTRSLCIFSMKTETLKRISDGDNSIDGYSFMENSKNLLIEIKLSQYKGDQFDNYRSPHKVMKYVYESGQLAPIISERIQSDLQNLVDKNN